VRLDAVHGHERARAALGRALERDRLPPALLFDGPDGIGKKRLALAVAQAALCEAAPAPEPCGACRTCRRIEAALAAERLAELRAEADRHPDEDVYRNFRLHPDLVLAEGWWLTRTGRPKSEPEIRIDQVRDLLPEIAGAPFEARRRVFVIEDAHSINPLAQNALLKSLEEPAPRSHVILVSCASSALLPTIRSRCQRLQFGPLPRAVIAERLAAEHGLAPETASLSAALAGGSLGSALAAADEGELKRREELLSLLERVSESGPIERARAAEALEQVEDPAGLLTLLRALLRDLAALRAGAEAETLLNPDLADRLARLARSQLGARALVLAEEANETRTALRSFASKPLGFDALLDALAGA
jgi:DNA polymerase-3 subunit delta'